MTAVAHKMSQVEQGKPSSRLAPPERVLSTLNKDGSRRWLRPRLSAGRFLKWRRIVAYALIVIYNILPWIKINGKPTILLDVPSREFTFFGTTFLPTDTLLLMLFIAGVFVTIFLLTALFGRVWCGWGCPQTVYMEFVYRPIERLFESKGNKRAGGIRAALKYIVFFIVSLHLAHTFLAYFVGAENLFQWTRQSPFDHPTAFIIVFVVTGLMMFDFCFFREQTCIVACPYGRFQSVMLDRNSLIISYDEKRGEPRGKKRRVNSPSLEGRGRGGGSTAGINEKLENSAIHRLNEDLALPQLGDCIDCKMCVTTCPTGIDIRDGLQMECIGCAQCIDACDTVMDKISRPRGLIRYSSQEAMQTGRRKLLRPRVVLYPALLSVIAFLFTMALTNRAPADITILREAAGGAHVYDHLDGGDIANTIRIKIVNRADDARTYTFSVENLEGATIACDAAPVVLQAGATVTVTANISAPAGAFVLGRAAVNVVVRDDHEYTKSLRYRLQGPWGTIPGRDNAAAELNETDETASEGDDDDEA